MKKLFILMFVAIMTIGANAQTLHTLIFVNKCEQNRQVDRTEDFNNMVSFFSDIARQLNYTHDLRTHTCSEFTAAQVDREINNLNVISGDIVVFYYSGHGYNSGQNKWPHMALLDKNYWQSEVLSKLNNRCDKAKLILCIADCCNKGSNNAVESGSFNPPSRNYVKQLFTGFQGHLRITMSASTQGEYSWSSLKDGAFFGICLRKALREKTSNDNYSAPTWESVLKYAKELTYTISGNKQTPQYSIEFDADPFSND
jgi:hypothetical protein